MKPPKIPPMVAETVSIGAQPSIIPLLASLVSPEKTAEILGVKVQTLACWRSTKRHSLSWVKLGNKKIMYRRDDITRFIEQNLVQGEA